MVALGTAEMGEQLCPSQFKEYFEVKPKTYNPMLGFLIPSHTLSSYLGKINILATKYVSGDSLETEDERFKNHSFNKYIYSRHALFTIPRVNQQPKL